MIPHSKDVTSIFKNSKVMTITRYGKEGAEASGRPQGTVMTVAFQLGRLTSKH